MHVAVWTNWLLGDVWREGGGGVSVRECDYKYNSRAWCLCDCVCVWNVQTYIISYRLHACTPYHASKPSAVHSNLC